MTSQPTTGHPLQEEIAFFEGKRLELCGEAYGKYVLIKNREVHGTYSTDADALEAGLQLFGETTFLIRQVLLHDEVVENPAYMLGLLNVGL